MFWHIWMCVATLDANPSSCDAWASEGECDANAGYMWANCKSECESVGAIQKKYNQRCPMPENVTPALLPGQLSKLFEEIPEKFADLQPELVSRNPPMIVFDNFLDSEKAMTWIELGKGRYTRSSGLEIGKDGSYKSSITSIRTSLNTWCQESSCLDHPVVRFTEERVSNITGFPIDHFEYGQMLYYFACHHPDDDNCSFYKQHGDFIKADLSKNQGPRYLTAFLYLNDVEKGGETVFRAGVSVTPKAGRLVLWPSVLDHDPDKEDINSHHEARPVLQGEKYGVNFWLHKFPFRTPHSKGCTM